MFNSAIRTARALSSRIAFSSSLFALRIAFRGVNQVSSTPPMRTSPSAAAAPPHAECPQSTTCFTLSWSTAYSMTADVLMSVGEMILAMLRCTKRRPAAGQGSSFQGNVSRNSQAILRMLVPMSVNALSGVSACRMVPESKFNIRRRRKSLGDARQTGDSPLRCGRLYLRISGDCPLANLEKKSGFW